MSRIIEEISRRRTFAIISHPDAGKTTLTEKLLLFSGAIQIAGAVKSNYTLLVFVLILSVILMISLANAISIYLRNNRWVAWLGILSILWVAVDLILYDFKLFF